MKVLAIIAGIGLVGYLAYQFLFPTYTHRYRLTIEVEVDGKVRSASSVIEVRIYDHRNSLIPSHGSYSSSYSGEAVLLELGEGRNLLALLGFGPTGGSGPYSISTLARDVINPLPSDKGVASFRMMSRIGIGKKTELTGQQIPTLVTFSDLRRPETARLLSIADIPRELGPTVRFRSAWIEITNDAVTRNLAEKIPWIKQETGRPALVAYHAWLAGNKTGPGSEPEILFRR